MDTDRNLLFGVLALQADLIDPDTFAKACTYWAADKDRPLADVLVAQGWLAPGDRADVSKLLERKLKKHGGDAKASLAEATSDQARQSLAAVADPDVADTLAVLIPPPSGHVLVATSDYAPENRDRYTLSRLHATGGIGRVWLARDASLGRDVALKELRPERADNPAARGRFLQEAQVTGQLEHPGIVPIYEVGRRPDDRAPFYTMRFVRGRTLAEVAAAYHRRRQSGEAGPLELRELLTTVVGVCQAVAYAHSRGVLHRDLKPQNVVLGDFGEVVVLDWGLAKVLAEPDTPGDRPAVAVSGEGSRDETIAGQVLGTPAYMAPEQAEGRLDRLDARTDVYGLGAILYEVLTGRPPFAGEDTQSILRRVIHDPPDRPRAVVAKTPAALEAVCLKALAKNPADRYPSAKAVADDVRHWLADEPVAAYPEPVAKRAGRWARRHRTLVAGVAAALVAAVGGLAAVLAVQARANADLRAANDRERSANADLAAANDRERAAKDQAQANFTLAQDAVEKYLGAVTNDPDLKKADLSKLRKKLLETAVPFFEKLAAGRSDEPELEAARGQAYQRLSGLRIAVGELPAAQADAGRAREVFARLAAEFPAVPEYREELAVCLDRMAINRGRTGDFAGAVDGLREAVPVYERLVADFPARSANREKLANAQNNLGVCLHNLGRADDAVAEYTRALAHREALAAEFPDKPDYRVGLARTLNSLAVMAYDRGKYDDSERHNRRAVALRETLLAESPADGDYLNELGISYDNLGQVLNALEKPAEALTAARKAIQVQDRAVEAFPSAVFFRRNLSASVFDLGIVLGELGRVAEAEAVFRRAVAIQEKLLADSPAAGEYRYALGKSYGWRADHLITLGRFADADAALGQARTHLERATADSPGTTIWLGHLGLAYAGTGRLHRERGETEAALLWYAKAVAAMDQCVKKNPDAGWVRGLLVGVHADRAETFDKLKRPADARADWDRAIELATPARVEPYRSYRLLSGGEPAKAAAAALELAAGDGRSGAVVYDCARVCGLAAAAGADRDKSVGRVVELLRQAMEKGYVNPDRTKRDDAFKELRSQPDFQKLLAELEARAKALAVEK